MGVKVLDHAVESTKARLKRDGTLLATVALALLGVPGMLLQIVLVQMPWEQVHSGGQTIALPNPSAAQAVALLALLLAQVLGQLSVARLLVGGDHTVRESLGVAGRRFLPCLGALLLVTLVATLVLLAIALLGGALHLLGTAGAALSAVVFVAGLGVLLLIVAALQLLVPEVVRVGGSPVRLLVSVWARLKGVRFALVLLLLLVFLITLVVSGAAQAILAIPIALAAGAEAGRIAGAAAAGLVGSLVSMLGLVLAFGVHERTDAQGSISGV